DQAVTGVAAAVLHVADGDVLVLRRLLQVGKEADRRAAEAGLDLVADRLRLPIRGGEAGDLLDGDLLARDRLPLRLQGVAEGADPERDHREDERDAQQGDELALAVGESAPRGSEAIG